MWYNLSVILEQKWILMKVYITKYALTRGILEREGVIDEEDGYVRVENGGWGGSSDLFYLDKNAFTSKEEAIAKAEELRLKKIENLKKQIKKLEQFRFCVEE
jgi:hypothetical protein